MAYVDTRIISRVAPPVWLGTAIGACRRALNALWRSIEIGRRRRMLHAMPDYLLKDIGISRSEIDYLAVAMVDDSDDLAPRHRRGTAR